MQPHLPHFFVSTLDDAQRVNSRNPHGITTINQLLLRRAGNSPDVVAVGMAVPEEGCGNGNWGAMVYSRF